MHVTCLPTVLLLPVTLQNVVFKACKPFVQGVVATSNDISGAVADLERPTGTEGRQQSFPATFRQRTPSGAFWA